MSKRSRKDYSCKEKVELLDHYQQLPLTSQRDAAAQLSVKRELSANDIAKKLTVLDAMRMISNGWSKISVQTIINCWRKAGFVTIENVDETEESQEGEVLVTPEGMSAADLDAWIQIDSNVQTDEEMSFEEEEREFLQNLAGKNDTEVIDVGESGEVIDVDECEPEDNPTNAEMRQCLHRLLVGLENRQFSNMDGFHRTSDQIKETLRKTMKEKNIESYFS